MFSLAPPPQPPQEDLVLSSPTHSSRNGSPLHLIRSYTPTSSRIATPISFERGEVGEDSVMGKFRSPFEDDNVRRGEMRELQASRIDWEKKAYSSSISPRSLTPPTSANSSDSISSLESQQKSPRLPHIYSSTMCHAPSLPSITTFIRPPRPRGVRPSSVVHPTPFYTPYPPSPRSASIAPLRLPLLPGINAISSTTSLFPPIQEEPRREIDSRLARLGISGVGFGSAGGGEAQFGEPPMGTYNPVIDRPVLSVSPRAISFPAAILQFDYQGDQEISSPGLIDHEMGRLPIPYRYSPVMMDSTRAYESPVKISEPRRTRSGVVRARSDPIKLSVPSLPCPPHSSTTLPSISNNSKRRPVNKPTFFVTTAPATFHPIPKSPTLVALYESLSLPIPLPAAYLVVTWDGHKSCALSPHVAETIQPHPENRLLVFPPGSVETVFDKKGNEVWPWSRGCGANDWVRMAEGDECLCRKFRYRQGKEKNERKHPSVIRDHVGNCSSRKKDDPFAMLCRLERSAEAKQKLLKMNNQRRASTASSSSG